MLWKKASGTGAVVAAWSGLVLGFAAWISAAQITGGAITVDTLATFAVSLTGNVASILSSGIIFWAYSVFIDPQDYDFTELDTHITLVEEDDLRGLSEEEKDPKMLKEGKLWILHQAVALAIIFIILWPLLSIPEGVFSKSYFAFWVMVALAWAFGAALTIIILPLTESWTDIEYVLRGFWYSLTCRTVPAKEDAQDKEESQKGTIDGAASAGDEEI